jgi:hypothetical protein
VATLKYNPPHKMQNQLIFHFTDSSRGPFELFRICFGFPIATQVSRA